MQPVSLLFLFFLSIGWVWGARRSRQSGALGREDRLAVVALPIAFACVFAVYLGHVFSMLFDDWSACRLAPTMALRYGYYLYYPPESGPILGMLYGPFTAVVYLPALAAGTPTSAILIGGLVTVFLVLFPLYVLNRREPGNSPTQPLGGHVGFLFAAAALLLHGSTSYIATSIHADAPAVGFGLLACAVLSAGGGKIGFRRVVFASALATLAALSKQFEVALIVALAAYLGLRFGARRAWTFLLGALFFSIFLVGGFGWLWGFDAMLQNTLLLPLRHPQREWLHVVTDFYNWVKGSAGVSLIVLVGVLVAVARSRRSGVGWREALLGHPAFLLILVALCLVPTSVMAVARFGAEANANHWLYYLIAAASLIVSRLAAGDVESVPARLGKRVAYLVSAATVCLTLPQLGHLRQVKDWTTNPQQQAYEFARANPQEGYFPWNPLSTLMADGKAYHFDYGVFDRELVGAKPTGDHFRAFLPSKLRWIVFRGVQDRMIAKTLDYLPEFSHRITFPQLPGWTAFERETDRIESEQDHVDHAR